MRVWGWLAAALVWLLAVAVVAAVAWFAMDSAGREVAGADGAVRLVAAAQPSGASASTAADVTRTPPSSTPSVPGSGGGRTGTYSFEAGDVVVPGGHHDDGDVADRPHHREHLDAVDVG